jgi:hypothetical protein
MTSETDVSRVEALVAREAAAVAAWFGGTNILVNITELTASGRTDKPTGVDAGADH